MIVLADSATVATTPSAVTSVTADQSGLVLMSMLLDDVFAICEWCGFNMFLHNRLTRLNLDVTGGLHVLRSARSNHSGWNSITTRPSHPSVLTGSRIRPTNDLCKDQCNNGYCSFHGCRAFSSSSGF